MLRIYFSESDLARTTISGVRGVEGGEFHGREAVAYSRLGGGGDLARGTATGRTVDVGVQLDGLRRVFARQ